MENFKAILIVPEYDKKRFRTGENLGIKYIVSYLKSKNVYCDYIEGNFSNNDEIVSSILNRRYNIIGFSINHQPLLVSCLEIINKIKKVYNPHVCLGGYYPTFNYNYVLVKYPEIDSIILTEGEVSFYKLCVNLNKKKTLKTIDGIVFREEDNKLFINKKPVLTKNLDDLPFPVRDENSLFMGNKHFFISSSRGCPFECSFCSVRSFYKLAKCKTWRPRSPENIIDELKNINKIYGLSTIGFIDPNFLGSTSKGYDRSLKIAKLLHSNFPNVLWSIDARCDDITFDLFSILKENGLAHVFLGVESFYDPTLSNIFNKKLTSDVAIKSINILKKLNIDIEIGFIMFHPYTTLEELKFNAEVIKKLNIGTTFIFSNKLSVYSNTLIYNRLYDEQNIREKDDGYYYDFKNKHIENIYQFIRESFTRIRDVETMLNKAIFDFQNKKDNYNFCILLKEKEKLSRFLSDYFLNTVDNFNNSESISNVFRAEMYSQIDFFIKSFACVRK